jgi:hypothetical protein
MKPSAPRAVASSLALAATFEIALFVSKETPSVYGHAPWLNDPYDTAVSFALFCIPLIVAPSVARLVADWYLPDRNAPERIADLQRACWVALVLVACTLAACWAAVAAGANRTAWNPVTAVQVAMLALFTGSTIAGATGIRRAAAAVRTAVATVLTDDEVAAPGSRSVPDWLGDMIGVGRILARFGGRPGRPVAGALDWADERVAPFLRRHPVGAAAVLASTVGVLVTIPQSLNEGYGPVVAAVFFCIATSGVFAFVASAGWYLRVVRTERAPSPRVPVIPALVLGAAAVPVALAFRAWFWSFVGAHPRGSGVGPLLLLLASAALLGFGVTIAAERIVQARRRPAQPSAR